MPLSNGRTKAIEDEVSVGILGSVGDALKLEKTGGLFRLRHVCEAG